MKLELVTWYLKLWIGERDAVVFWTKSWIRDMKDLYEVRYWDMMV